MSDTIDQRVVEMRFDNKQFESNVATSMSTLDKLKQKLNLSGASKGLENIDSASKKVNMNGLGSAVDAVKIKFSALEVMGVTALANITNSAVNTGKQMISALTIDPIRSGLQEYETQINSVQTILANTSSKGTTIDQVNAALDELNRYADLTIYNFTEMTRNIGTFTAAGIDLDTSVSAIQGIANLAAVSGSTSQQASVAMYQLSQALASGTVKLMDWNSVVNAGMGGQVFQDALKETSKLLGTGAEAAIEAKGSFRESLTTGWLTSEVLTETLKKFTTSGANEYVAKYTGLSVDAVKAALDNAKAQYGEADAIDKAAEALAEKSGKSKEEIKNALEMARTAEDAATKVKTFSQLWDVLKEAAQSGWSKTWQIIIGDFEEAKALLTPLADFLTNIISRFSDARNNLLESALGKSFSSLSEKIKSALSPIDKVIDGTKKVAQTFDKTTEVLGNLDEIASRVIHGSFGNGKDRYDKLTKAGENYYRIQNKVNEALGDSFRYTDEQVAAQDKLLGKQVEITKNTSEVAQVTSDAVKETDKLTDAQKKQIKELAKLSDEQLRSKGYTEEQIKAFAELKATAEKLGIPLNDFIDNLDEINGRWLLIDSFKNIGQALIKVFSAIGKAWREVFSPVQSDQVFNVIAAIHKFTASLIPSEENLKLLTRTFKGLFAVLDIIKTVLGGAFRIAFKIASEVLSYFDLNILDVTAAIGDALVAFHDWFESIFNISGILNKVIPVIQTAISAVRNWFAAFKETKGIQNLINYIQKLGNSIKNWWNSLKTSENLPKTIAEGIVKAFSSIPKIISTVFSNIWKGLKESFSGTSFNPLNGFIDKIQNGLKMAGQTIVELGKILLEKVNSFLTAHGFKEISINAIAGLVEGLKNGASNAWDAAIEMVKSLVEKVKNFLGIHSPSTVFAAIGGFIIAGLIMGLRNGIPDSLGAVKDVFQPILDWLKNLDFGSVIAAAFGIGALGTIRKAVDAISAFAAPLKGLGGIFESTKNILDKSAKPIAKTIKSFSKVLNAVAFDIKAEGIKKLGETLLMLVGAIIVLTYFDPGELWNAVIIVAALALILVGLSFAMSKINDSSAKISKEGVNIKNMSSGIIGIGAAILLIAIAVKTLGKLDKNQAIQGFLGLAGIVAALVIVTAAFGHFVKGKASENADKFGKTMIKLAVALLLMTIVVKMLGNMDQGALIQGGIAIIAFAGIMVGLMAATKLISGSKNVDAIGSTLLKISLAIGVMALVAKLLGEMDPKELIQGGLAIAAFAGIIVGLMAATKLISGSKNVDTIGSTLFKIALAIGVMALAAKILGGMDPKELIQGGLAITAFAGIIVGLMAATKLISGSKNVEKIGTTLLAISGAIAIMALTALMLSMISWEGFAKGTIMILAFSGIIVGLMAATKLISGSKNIDTIGKTLLTVSGAIAILAGIAVLLGLVPTENLIKGVLVVTVLAAIMAGLLAVTKLAKKCIGTIVALTVMIAVLAGAVYLISTIPADSAIVSAIVLGGLMLVMAGVLLLLSHVGKMASEALMGVIALTLMIVPLLAFIGALALMSLVPNAIANALTLAGLVTVLTLLLIPLTIVGQFVEFAIGGIIALTLMAVPLLAFIGVLALMNCVENAMANTMLLTTFMTIMADLLVKIALVAPLAVVGVAALTALSLLMGAIGVVAVAIGALMEKFPSIQTFLDSGLPVLEQLAGSIGSMIGKFAGGIITGIGEAVMSLLPQLALSLSAFAVGVQPFVMLVGNVDSSVLEGVGYLTGAILLLTVADFIAGVGQFLSGGVSFADLGAQLLAFGTGAAAFFILIKNVDEGAIQAASNVANMILTLTAAELISAISEMFGGSTDFADFGEKLNAFGKAVVGFSDTISGKIDVEAVNAATNAGKMLVELNKSLPRSGGWVQDIIGEQDFGKFAESCKAFLSCIIDINATLSQEGYTIESEKISQIVEAGKQFSELNKSLPRSGGIAQDFAGEKDLAGFGESVKAFAGCMIKVNEALSQEGLVIQSKKMAQLAEAGTKFNELNKELPKTGGIAQDFAGEKDLARFGESVKAFADCMIKVNEAVSQEGFTVNLAAIEDLKQAGFKMNELQNALPKTDGWWQKIAGSKDIGDFGEKVESFGKAMVGFSTSSEGIKTDAVNTSLQTANRIKTLISSLTDFDTDALDDFIDDGIDEIGKAMSDFGDEVKDIDTTAVEVAVSAASKLKTLISGLVDLDTSGVSKFKPKPIAEQIKSYAKTVKEIDTGKLSASIAAAIKLRAFISDLSNFDPSGVNKFKIGSIGFALRAYGNAVAETDFDAISRSVAVASQLKNFISSLSGMDSSGITSFKTAIDHLATTNVDGFVNAFSGISTNLVSAGADMINGLIRGMQSRLSAVKTIIIRLVSMSSSSLKSKLSTFMQAGQTMVTMLANGFTNKSGLVKIAISKCLIDAVNRIRDKYEAFKKAGSHLVDGFCKGIKENTWKAEAKARDMAQAAIDAANEKLDINSPSKVFKKIGARIPEGFAIGIGMLGGEVKDSVTSMTSTAINSSKKAMGSILDALSSDMDTQPTIRPIVDLSDVQTGVNAIGGLFADTKTISVRSNLNTINSAMNRKIQNGSNDDIVSAINKLNNGLENSRGDIYNFGDITYDDGSGISDAVQTLVRAARMGRRV